MHGGLHVQRQGSSHHLLTHSSLCTLQARYGCSKCRHAQAGCRTCRPPGAPAPLSGHRRSGSKLSSPEGAVTTQSPPRRGHLSPLVAPAARGPSPTVEGAKQGPAGTPPSPGLLTAAAATARQVLFNRQGSSPPGLTPPHGRGRGGGGAGPGAGGPVGTPPRTGEEAGGSGGREKRKRGPGAFDGGC